MLFPMCNCINTGSCMFVVMLEATVAFFTRQGRGLSVGDCFLSDLALSIGIYTCSFSVQH